MSSKVLVVDDSATIRQQLRFTLSQAGYDVLEAEDGEDGVRKLTTNADTKLVICDVNMPKMNGIEMLNVVKNDNRVNQIPIVMLTTEGSAELIAKAKSAGAKGWLVKPFKPELLLSAVKKLAG
jgi:two-component system chemotaxis response regulator CheY